MSNAEQIDQLERQVLFLRTEAAHYRNKATQFARMVIEGETNADVDTVHAFLEHPLDGMMSARSGRYSSWIDRQ